MNKTYGEWMLSIDSEFHTANRRLELWISVSGLFKIRKGLLVRRIGAGLEERSFQPTAEQIEGLNRLTERTGVLERPLDVSPIVDDSDYTHRISLVCSDERRQTAWIGTYQLIGFQGPDADGLQGLIAALRAFANPEHV